MQVEMINFPVYFLPQFQIISIFAMRVSSDLHLSNSNLHAISAALCVLGGHREMLRPGVPVEICSAQQRKKVRRAKLLSYDLSAFTSYC